MYQGKVHRVQGGDELVVASGGKITVEAGGQINLIAPKGTIYFVDSVGGSDGNDGLSWDTALATIAAAVALAVAGDTILIKGSFSEAVTLASTLTGLSIIGAGTTPKEAQWTGDADEVCLTIQAEHVHVQNIYFRPPAYSAGTPAAIQLDGANYTRIVGCRFQGRTGSRDAIYSATATSDNVAIVGNEFIYLNTATYGAAIHGVNAGGVQYSGWQIRDNVFNSCVTAIKLSCRIATITGNTVAEYGINASGAVAAVLALGIDLSGDDATNSGANAVWNNQLGGTYNATLYKVGASGDQWSGNWNVITGGVTAANPA